MRRPSSPVNIFKYLDYRKFLRAWYDKKKQTRASFSFRTFSERAGFRSTNFYKLVMEGKRNLTEESIVKFSTGLKLNKQETEFFHNLVCFNQAKTHEEKDKFYQRLLQSRKYTQLKPIEKHQYEYCSSWYHTVIRELATAKDFDGTPAWIVKRIYPEISEQQVQKSLELLEKLGLLEMAPDGQWKQSSSVVSTGSEVQSLTVFNYHKNLLALSQDILEEVDSEMRDVSAMTLGITRDQIPVLKQKIHEFRQEILKLVSVTSEPEEVAQVNIQMFPLTKLQRKETS